MDAVAIMSDEVRELIRRRGLDPARDQQGLRRLVEDVVADYDARTLSGVLPPLADGGRAVKQVLDAVAGFGALQLYLDDPDGGGDLGQRARAGCSSRGTAARADTMILTAQEVDELVERMLKAPAAGST